MLIFSMIVIVVIGDLWLGSDQHRFLYVAGALSWIAVIVLLPGIPRTQLLITGLIATLGVLLLLFAWIRGAEVQTGGLLSTNARLLTMIAAVGFLRLVAMPAGEQRARLPVGWGAYVKTLFGVSLFGSVINISAPIMVADRLSCKGGLDRLTSQSITRVFSGCSAWSPFYGGMAAVLTYVPGAQVNWLMPACLPFAVVGLLVILVEARVRHRQKIALFTGYPVRFGNLWIPLALALVVVLMTSTLDDISILTAIAAGALLVTVIVLIWNHGVRGAVVGLDQHIRVGLPSMVNELSLFLSAGIIAVGLASLIGTGLIPALNFTFDGKAAVLLLGGIVALACVGVHPLIVVSGGTPVILSLAPDPNLLAATYLLSWSLGTSASPLSGTHLVFQGRYGVPAWKAAMWNWPYVWCMYLFAIPLLLGLDVISRA